MGSMGVWLYVVYALAVARVTGLVTTDTITEPIRDGIIRGLGSDLVAKRVKMLAAARGWLSPSEQAALPAESVAEPSTDEIIEHLRSYPLRWVVAKLITCAWCAGLWVSAAAAPLALFYGSKPWLFIPALALAFGQVVGMISNLGRD